MRSTSILQSLFPRATIYWYPFIVEKQLTWEIFQLAILLIATHTITSSEIRVDKWSAEMCRKASEIRKLKAIKYPITSKKYVQLAWWRHQMETFSALLAICAGNSPHKGQWRGALMFFLPYLMLFFYLRLNKRLSKQWWGWWFETLSCPLWRHRNVTCSWASIITCRDICRARSQYKDHLSQLWWFPC